MPEFIIATIDPPDGLHMIGKPVFIEARTVKIIKRHKRHIDQEKELA